jgi:hypothetical protein
MAGHVKHVCPLYCLKPIFATQGGVGSDNAANAQSIPAAAVDGLVDFLRGHDQVHASSNPQKPAGLQARPRGAIELELAEIRHLIEELHHTQLNGEMSPHIIRSRSLTSREPEQLGETPVSGA